MNRTFNDFVDLIVSKNSTIITRNEEVTVKDIVDKAIKNKNSDLKISRTSNGIEFLVDFISAGLGGGTVLREMGTWSSKEFPDSPDDYFFSDTIDKTKLSHLFYSFTSGRKADPRLVPQTIDTIWEAAESLAIADNRDSNSIFANCLLSPGVAFLSVAMLPSMITGGTIVDIRKFPGVGEPRTESSIFGFATILSTYRPTHSIIYPHIIPVVERTRSWRTTDLSFLKHFLVTNEICPPGVFDRLREKGCIPYNLYGTTEFLNPISYTQNESYLEMLPSIEWKVEDNVLFCRKSDSDWYSTNDAVSQEGDKIRILGSKNFEIEHNGSKVYPEIYEAVARSNLKVVDALLRKKHDKLIFYYYGRISPEEVTSILAQHFNQDKMPDSVQQVDEVFPRSIKGTPIRSNDFVFKFEV
jgi:acyl-CoA synthetase (AMP-forming)/AMP-acid ligase II